MPANNTSRIVKELHKKYPDKIGMLNTPQSFKKPYGSWALDNGCFKYFDEELYFSQLHKSKKYSKPLFIVAPDCVGCHSRTLALWHYYYKKIKPFNYPIAFVAQNGCQGLGDVPKEADWIFVGGLDPWKTQSIHKFIGNRPVHVGRVNGKGRLKYCESIGVSSVDGTGWLRQRGKQFFDFMEYFNGEKQNALFA